MGENWNAYRVLVKGSDEKRQPGRSRLRLEDNIGMDLREIEWGYGLHSFRSG
jgi:hypothetical protein